MRDIYKTIKEGAWSKMSKWQKAFRIIMWVVAAGLIAWGSTKAFEDAGTIVKAFQENTLNQLLPDGVDLDTGARWGSAEDTKINAINDIFLMYKQRAKKN